LLPLVYLGGGGGARRAVDGVEGTPLGVPPGLAGAVGARRAGAPDKEVRARPAWPSTSPCSMIAQPQHTVSKWQQDNPPAEGRHTEDSAGNKTELAPVLAQHRADATGNSHGAQS
jgi:hypothetical protein